MLSEFPSLRVLMVGYRGHCLSTVFLGMMRSYYYGHASESREHLDFQVLMGSNKALNQEMW